MMIEVKNHSKYHFRAYNFQNFPGGHVMMIEVKIHSKYHFRAYNFQNVPGGACPQTP